MSLPIETFPSKPTSKDASKAPRHTFGELLLLSQAEGQQESVLRRPSIQSHVMPTLFGRLLGNRGRPGRDHECQRRDDRDDPA